MRLAAAAAIWPATIQEVGSGFPEFKTFHVAGRLPAFRIPQVCA
jgi:hypothetical protein